MTINALKQNIQRIKEIIREAYVFENQLKVIKNLELNNKAVINTQEKKLLSEAVNSLIMQLKILNNSLPDLIENIKFFKRLAEGEGKLKINEPERKNLIQIKYKPNKKEEKIAVTINDKDKKKFLKNLSKSNLSINQLKTKFAVERPVLGFGKPNFYAKISNHFFKEFSNKLLSKWNLVSLNKDLRKMNSPFMVGTYISMIFFTITIFFISSLFLFALLLFYNVSLTFPFLTPVEGSFLIRFAKIFWIIPVIPLIAGIIMYFYPKSEGKTFGSKINQELPFVAIHMSAIATSGIEPVNIFKIIIKSKEYKYTRAEFKKLLNLVNFQGYNLVTALKKSAKSSPSAKLKELFDGLATTITSGGDMHEFLDKHAEGLLFDYKLDREKYTKTSETFMDIYISIIIAAPMILLMLFVIMGSTGMYFFGLSTPIISFLIILAIVFLNIIFLMFLKLKQPVF